MTLGNIFCSQNIFINRISVCCNIFNKIKVCQFNATSHISDIPLFLTVHFLWAWHTGRVYIKCPFLLTFVHCWFVGWSHENVHSVWSKIRLCLMWSASSHNCVLCWFYLVDGPLLSVCVDCDGLITQALLTANFESAVDVCIQHGRWAEAVILAIAGGPQLLAETEKRFFETNKSNVNQVCRCAALHMWRKTVVFAVELYAIL